MNKLIVFITLQLTFFNTFAQRTFSDDFIFKIGLNSALMLHRDDMPEIRKFLIEELGFIYDIEKSSNNYNQLMRSEITFGQNPTNEIMGAILDSRETNKKQCSMILTSFKNGYEIDLNSSFINFLNKHPKIIKKDNFYFFILKDSKGIVKFN
jgi:hypothetical protein